MKKNFIVGGEVAKTRNGQYKKRGGGGGGGYFSLVDAVSEGFRTGFGAKLWI